MFAPVTHILPLTIFQRRRVLPAPGRVVVRKGQKVNPLDVVAETNRNPEHLLLDLAHGLGVPPERCERFMRCEVGAEVSEGDILAGPVGFAKRVFRSPRDGRVIQIRGGQTLLEVRGQPFELKAGLPGVVVELIEDRGVVIEASGSVVQAVWGNGRIDSGILAVIAGSPDELLATQRLDVRLRGAIALAAYCRDAAPLKAAADLPLRGLILASMEARLCPLANESPFPLVVTEGFGRIPMNSIAYKLLSTNEGREVAVNAEAWQRSSGSRPEVVIPLPTSGEITIPKDSATFSTGAVVRALRAPYAGMVGTLVGVQPGLVRLPNGLLTQAAAVRLEDGVEAIIPLANLELIQ